MNEKNNKSVGTIISIVLFVILIGSIFTNGFGIKSSLFGPSDQKVGENILGFINQNLLQPGTTASLASAQCKTSVDLCKVKFKIAGQEVSSYVSSDGKIFFPEAIEVENFEKNQNTQQPNQQQKEVPTSEKPKANLFIMSYCPYGLQSQKAMLPVMELLKQEADININFVDYAMHDKKELDENLRQFCIQKQNQDEFINYLNCFVKDGNSDQCLSSLNINQGKLLDCIKNTDQEYKITQNYNNKDTWLQGTYPKFGVESDLNKEYGVAGSPTFILNGVKVSPKRTPEDYKSVICDAFISPPKDCEKTLSKQSPVPSFGIENTNASTNASCN